ncbi:MAG: two-component system sensor histidine kinase/response regulator [Alteromonadaceae bacterium]|jgi:two-component system sensor histidine kinase/response regulator
MVIIAIIIFDSENKVNETSHWVTHTQTVISDGQELSKLLVDMETDERGFLITGNESFLVRYKLTQQVWNNKMAQTKALVSDDPTQVRRLEKIDQLQKQWIKQAATIEIEQRRRVKVAEKASKSPIDNTQTATFETLVDVIALIESEVGKNIIDKARSQLSDFIYTEQQLMQMRVKDAHTAATNTTFIVIGGTIATVIIALIVALFVSNNIANKLKVLLKATQNVTAGDFEQHITVTTNDEFGQLGEAFNTMTSTIKQSTEKLTHANQAKGDFLANMSHEIRTPMNRVLGMLSLLEETQMDNNQQELVDTIRVCGDGLMVVLNDILDYSKIEAGKMSLELQPFNLSQCIENTIYLHNYRASLKGIDLCYHVDADLSVGFLGDLTRIRQILMNLLSNAIKFTDNGDIKITVSSNSSEGNSEGKKTQLRFAVSDKGIGISDEDQSKLFKSFSQVDTSITRRYGGTGLGLAICYQLTQLMDGKLWLTSEQGKGSTFYFDIPLQAVELSALPKSISRSSLNDKKAALPALHILIAEDNQINQLLALKLLENLGYKADVANDGQEAIDALHRRPYDVILMDMQMPVLDGVSATKAIIKQWPYGERPRIIAMTANILPEDRKKCMDADMEDFIAKPVEIELLVDALLKCADSARNTDALPPTPQLSGHSSSHSSSHSSQKSSPQPSQSQTTIILDIAAIKRRFEGIFHVYLNISELFIREYPKMLTDIKQTIDDNDAQQLKATAHSLKGALKNLYAESVAKPAQQLEKMGSNDDGLSQAATIYQQLKEQVEQLVKELETLIENERS